MEEESTADQINDLILELSLACALPVGVNGRSYSKAAAAAFSLANRTKNLPKKDLGAFEYTVEPLLSLLSSDIENPIASKAAFGLRTLMDSVTCMQRFLQCQGLETISRILDILLVKRASELKNKIGEVRQVVENLAVIYRETVRFHQWKVVNVGAIRHCVLLLKLGDVALKTIASTTLAYLSTDLDICKQLFSYGAIKPILLVSDLDTTNEPCMLAGLGCIIQLCKIPEIGFRMFQQGALPVLEKALHTHHGHGNLAIREKSIYALALLAKIESLKPRVCSVSVLKGITHEFFHGTDHAKSTILQMLLSVHLRYGAPQERALLLEIRDALFDLLNIGPWHTRNLCIKAIVVLYTLPEDKMHFVERGFVDSLFGVIGNKSHDLQEAPIVAFLYLCLHPELPDRLIDKGVAEATVRLLDCEDAIIRELAVVLLKALNLYAGERVEAIVPEQKRYLMKKDPYNPNLYGAEYGELIQEYLQTIVENRRDDHYLARQFSEAERAQYGLTEQELEAYQNTFMELDADCSGTLDSDELKMLMVLIGEEMDIDELDEVLAQYDTDQSGELDFKEFVVMMKGWNERFGKGIARVLNVATKRGAVGRARREFGKFWNQARLEAAQVIEAKRRRQLLEEEKEELRVKYLKHEQMALMRENAMQLRELGLVKSRSYQQYGGAQVYRGGAGNNHLLRQRQRQVYRQRHRDARLKGELHEGGDTESVDLNSVANSSIANRDALSLDADGHYNDDHEHVIELEDYEYNMTRAASSRSVKLPAILGGGSQGMSGRISMNSSVSGEGRGGNNRFSMQSGVSSMGGGGRTSMQSTRS